MRPLNQNEVALLDSLDGLFIQNRACPTILPSPPPAPLRRWHQSLLCRRFCATGLIPAHWPASVGTGRSTAYYTNDTRTPGNRSWEINLGYMPFLYDDRAMIHVPDVDINYGVGDRIQLTYENAWLRVQDGADAPKYGLGQDILGVKWRFYDNQHEGFAISTFPQLSINNPDHSARRGITPPGASLIIPVEFSKKLGPIDLNWEVGYNTVHLGPDGWIAGFMIGHDISKKLELDAEFYGLGAFDNSNNQQTQGAGARYKLRPPFVLLLMAGRSVAPARNGQPYFVGYFGIQFLLPPRPFNGR